MIRSLLIFLALFAVSNTAYAQASENEEKDKFYHLVIENDSLAANGDDNYTSGVRFSYLNLGAEFPELAYVLDDYIPTFELNKNSSVYWSVGHNLYTPQDITDPTPDPNDRPYAAFAYGSLGLVTVTGDHIDEVEATLGIVGPLAFGEEIQSFVHEYVTPSSPEPEGWDYQLDNEPALMLAWQRRWPEFHMEDIAFDLNFGVEPNVGITLGNVYTHANAGISFKLGPEAEKWQDSPTRVRPAIPGTGYLSLIHI